MAESVKTFQAHLTAVMDSLVRASVCEITKLFQDTVNDYLVEISLNRKENEALKLRLRLTENKLRNERKYGLCWAAGRRAAALLGTDDAARKTRRVDLQRGKQRKEWCADAWEEGTAGARDERRDVFRVHLPTGGGGAGEEEEERMCVSGERKEVPSIKEEVSSQSEVESYGPTDSLRLLQEALQMNQSETSPRTSSPTHGEVSSAPTCPESAAAGGWEEQAPPLSEEQMTSGDELSGLETALKAECEREEAESGLGSDSHEACGTGVAFIGLDGQCSSQRAASTSSHRSEPPELRLPSAPTDKEERDGSGADCRDVLHFCQRCGCGFNSACDLAEHSCPGSEEQPYRCSACGRGFGHAWSLKSHECVQAGEQPHRCELCGKRFTHSRSLERHQLVHTGERPHRCPQCGRSFSRLGNLERHQRIHTGERPYECSVCGKRFSRVEYLKRHQQIHAGERAERNSHHCSQCNQTFVDTEQFKQHPCPYNL